MKIFCIYKKLYFVSKAALTYCEKNCYSDREKRLKFGAEGREFKNSNGKNNWDL